HAEPVWGTCGEENLTASRDGRRTTDEKSSFRPLSTVLRLPFNDHSPFPRPSRRYWLERRGSFRRRDRYRVVPRRPHSSGAFGGTAGANQTLGGVLQPLAKDGRNGGDHRHASRASPKRPR